MNPECQSAVQRTCFHGWTCFHWDRDQLCRYSFRLQCKSDHNHWTGHFLLSLVYFLHFDSMLSLSCTTSIQRRAWQLLLSGIFCLSSKVKISYFFSTLLILLSVKTPGLFNQNRWHSILFAHAHISLFSFCKDVEHVTKKSELHYLQIRVKTSHMIIALKALKTSVV